MKFIITFFIFFLGSCVSNLEKAKTKQETLKPEQDGSKNEKSLSIKEQFIIECPKALDELKKCVAQINTQESRSNMVVLQDLDSCVTTESSRRALLQKFHLEPIERGSEYIKLVEEMAENCGKKQSNEAQIKCVFDNMVAIYEADCQKLAERL